MLLLCSDGVWEFIKFQEAINMVLKEGPGNAMQAAKNLASEARQRWLNEEEGQVVDDITVIVVYLQEQAPKDTDQGA